MADFHSPALSLLLSVVPAVEKPICRALMALSVLCFPAECSLASSAAEPETVVKTDWINPLEDGFKHWTEEGNTYGKHVMPPGVWSLTTDGLLKCDGRGFGFLRYNKSLKDFIFTCEYKLPKDGNSGIGIRGVVYDGKTHATRPSRASFELQMLCTEGIDAKGNMSLYRYLAPMKNPLKSAGEWNQLKIECVGPRIRVWLNEVLVQDVDQREHESIKDKPLSGYLSVQNHHCPVTYRHLRLQVLGDPLVGKE